MYNTIYIHTKYVHYIRGFQIEGSFQISKQSGEATVEICKCIA